MALHLVRGVKEEIEETIEHHGVVPAEKHSDVGEQVAYENDELKFFAPFRTGILCSVDVWRCARSVGCVGGAIVEIWCTGGVVA